VGLSFNRARDGLVPKVPLRQVRLMRRVLLGFLVVLLGAGCVPKSSLSVKTEYQPQNGDFLFQSLPHNPLIDAIEGSTGSPYSHCGIVVNRNGVWMVIEAIGPVKETFLLRWIGQGRDGATKVNRVIEAAERYKGRPYDLRYDMDDTKIYCSELLWKATRDATGIELGKLQRLGDLNWQPHEQVIRQLENGQLPLDRQMITPRAVAEDARLKQVFRQRM
jgi:hypothetical protein